MSIAVSQKQQLTGQGVILVTALLMSTNGLFIKLLLWHPAVIVCLRSIIAVLFLLTVRIISPPPKERNNFSYPFWAAAFAFAGTMFVFVIANKLTTAANAIMLQYSAPVWAALLGWLLIREKPHWEQWSALVFIFVGLALILWNGFGKGSLLGDFLAVLSGILFGAQTVFLRMLKDGNPRDSMLLAHVICVIIGIPFLFLHPPVFTAPAVLSILFMGVFQIGLSSLLFAYGIKIVSALEALLIDAVEPLLNPVWVLVITGEKPALIALIGGMIILFVVVASTIIGMRRDSKAQKNG